MNNLETTGQSSSPPDSRRTIRRGVAALAVAFLALGVLAVMAFYKSSHVGIQHIIGQLVFDGTIAAAGVAIVLRAVRRPEWGRAKRRLIIWCVGGGSIVNLFASTIVEITRASGGLEIYLSLCMAVISLLATIAWLVGLCFWGASEGRTFFAPRYEN